MANIKRCDRCGEIYEPNQISDFHNWCKGFIVQTCSIPAKPCDLCDSCQDKLISFMKNNKDTRVTELVRGLEKATSLLEAYRRFRKDVEEGYENCDDISGEIKRALNSISYVDP